jgi:hypothetical protein
MLSPFTPRFSQVISSYFSIQFSVHFSIHAFRATCHTHLTILYHEWRKDRPRMNGGPNTTTCIQIIILYDNCRCLLPTGVQKQLDLNFITTMLMIQISWGMTSCGLVQIPFRLTVLLPSSEQNNTSTHKDYYPYTKPSV